MLPSKRLLEAVVWVAMFVFLLYLIIPIDRSIEFSDDLYFEGVAIVSHSKGRAQGKNTHLIVVEKPGEKMVFYCSGALIGIDCNDFGDVYMKVHGRPVRVWYHKPTPVKYLAIQISVINGKFYPYNPDFK